MKERLKKSASSIKESTVKTMSSFAETSGTFQFFAHPIKFGKEKLGFEFWQRFSKALIIVVAVMPAGGILISVGRLFNPAFINALGASLPKDHGLFQFGNIIEQIGWFFIVNLGVLFAIAIAGNWSDDKAGGAFAGFIAYALFHTTSILMSTGIYGSIIEKIADDGTILRPGILGSEIFMDSTLGIKTLKGSQVFSGILLGFVAANVYNKYHTFDKLPGPLSFFGGTRFVPFAIIFYSQIWALLFAITWPWISQVITIVGTWLAQSGGIVYAPFIYGAGERLLLPFGLHHMITIPMNYTDLGGLYQSLSGLETNGAALVSKGQDPLWLAWIGDVSYLENIHKISGAANMDAGTLWGIINNGDHADLLSELNARASEYGSKTTAESLITAFANTTPARFKVGQVVASTTFLPLGALGMYMAVPKKDRSPIMSIYFSAAMTVCIAGITEPIEFMFAFISPLMYLGYGLLSGVMWGFVDVLALLSINLRIHAFGLIEIIARMPQMLVTTLWKDFLFFLVYSAIWGGIGFAYFHFATKFLKPMIPGFEGENEEISTSIGVNKAKPKNKLTDKENDANTAKIIKALGGKENILKVDNCFTRLRVSVEDPSKIDESSFKETGAIGTIVRGKSIQVIYGGKVEKVRRDVDNFLKEKTL